MLKITMVVLTLAIFTACNWVQLTNEGRGVQLATQSGIANCSRVGTTASATTSRVLAVDRGGSKVQDELVTLARNEAGLMGGNTIVADSTIQEGRQTFIVYSCP